jgi:transcriptional regulator with XRE-family HTH domain
VSTSGRSARLDLAALIKRLREAATENGQPMTQNQLAQLIGRSQPTVAKIESGAIPAQPKTIDAIITALGVDEETAERMRELSAFDRVGTPWSRELVKAPEHAQRFLLDEQLARELLSWHENRIPGSLQSRQFALQQFDADGRADVAPYLRMRLRRASLFTSATLRNYACVLPEDLFRTGCRRWGRDVVIDEIDHLRALNDPARRPPEMTATIAIHILPSAAGPIHQPVDFTVVHMPNPEQSYVYIEHVCDAQYCGKPDDLKQATEAWHELLGHALDPARSNELLDNLRAEIADG